MNLLLTLSCVPRIEPGLVPVDEANQPVPLLELPDEASPNLYLAAWVRAGSAFDPLGKEGIAHLTARAMVEGGAATLGPDEVRERLYGYGNELEVVVDREWVSFRLRCHADHAASCANLFGSMLATPIFEDGTVQRLREEAEYDVSEGILASKEALGNEVFETWTFTGHPYGHPVEGRSGVLPLLVRDDVVAFHQQHYLRATTFVGMAGKVTIEARLALEERLADLPGHLPPELALQAPEALSGRELLLVRTAGPGTGFHLGHPLAVERADSDWAPLYVAFVVFGAHRQSFGRLFRTLRTDRGLNYGDYAYMEPFLERPDASMAEQGTLRTQPHFTLWIRPTTDENAPFALKLAIDELERFVDQGLTAEELEDVRSHLRGYLPLLAQNPGRRLAYAMDAAATGQPDPLEVLAARLDTLQLAEINAALKAHIHPESLRIVGVSGDADTVVRRLVEDAPTPIVYADVAPSPEQAARDEVVAGKALSLHDHPTVDAEGIFR